MEAAIRIELMNNALAERSGEPQKSLLLSKYGTFSDFALCPKSSKKPENKVTFRNKHENFNSVAIDIRQPSFRFSEYSGSDFSIILEKSKIV